MRGKEITNQSLLDDLRHVAAQLGHSPKLNEYVTTGVYSCSVIIRRFGGWRRAIIAAGLPLYMTSTGHKVRPRLTSKHEIVLDVRRVARDLAHYPTSHEYVRLGSYSLNTASRKFGTWQDVIEACGLVYNPRSKRHAMRHVTKKEVIADILRVKNMLKSDAWPTYGFYKQEGRFSRLIISKHAGSGRWKDVLHTLAGVPIETAKKYAISRYVTTAEYLDRVRALERKLKRCPTYGELEAAGVRIDKVAARLNGHGVLTVLKAAGCDLSKRRLQLSKPPATTAHRGKSDFPVDLSTVHPDTVQAVNEFFKQ